MTLKLSWNEITERYAGEWVELVDYAWDETEADPTAGVVRAHSKDRKEFDVLICRDSPLDSALLFVGKIVVPEGMSLSSNQHQFIKSEFNVRSFR